MRAGEVWRLIKTPLTLLVLVGVLGFGAYWGWTNVMRPAPPASSELCVEQPVEGELTSDQVRVRVYNGGAPAGTAAAVGDRLERNGFGVASVGNTDETVTVTIVVGVSEDDPAVQLAVAHFHEAELRPDQRTDGTVDVLIGSSYAGMVFEAPESIEIEGDSVCLPPTESPDTEG